MKRLIRFLFLPFLILNCAAISVAEQWRELSGEHFIIYYLQEEKVAKDVLDKAEFYYRNIASDLGYARYSNFWTWDKRVKIYIYPDRDSFLKATHQPEWSEGMADYTHKQIISYAWSSGFLDSLLPHEIAHLIFRDFIGFKGEIPLWLDEGVAQWAEAAKRQQARLVIKQYLKGETLISLEDLTRLDIRHMKEKDGIYIRTLRPKDGKEGLLFLSTDQLVNTYYIQAISLVGFLIEKYGSDSFAYFCRQLRDGKTLEEALRFAYPDHIRDLPDLERSWFKYLEESE